jgi:hypothetical protein
LRAKAEASFQAALSLRKARNFNSAASRAYYAVYQAIVAELEAQNYRPEQIDPVMAEKKAERDPTENERPEKWRHSVICGYKALGEVLHLGYPERDAVKRAWILRVKADYEPDDVSDEQLGKVMDRLLHILPDLGISV